MKPEFYNLDPEIQFMLAIRKLNHYLPQALNQAERGELSNTLNKRCAKWASRLGRAVFSLNPELRLEVVRPPQSSSQAGAQRGAP